MITGADPSITDPPPFIYRLVTGDDWARALESGSIPLAPIDEADGYIHLSPPEQFLETARLYFQGHPALFAVELEAKALGEALRWEEVPSRGGRLFPHLYAAQLPLSAVVARLALEPLESGGFRISGRHPYPA